jgi:T5orf172 domain
MAKQKPCTWVYFILCPRENLVKIGFTRDHPDKRLADLRTTNASPLEPLMAIPKGIRFERMLHDRFARFRDHGEWFRYVDEIQSYIKDTEKKWPDNYSEHREPPRFSAVRLYRLHKQGAAYGELAFKASIPISRVKVLIKVGRKLWREKRSIGKERQEREEQPCVNCDGQGRIGRKQCPICGGSGLSADKD